MFIFPWKDHLIKILTDIVKTMVIFYIRKFGPDGYAIKDYDIADSHNSNDHVHDIKGNRVKKCRSPSKKERREINKAKKKGDFQNDWLLKNYN